MKIVRAGRRLINLRYLVEVDEGGPEPDAGPEDAVVTVTMLRGRDFTVHGPAALAFLGQLYEIAPEAAPHPPQGPTVSGSAAAWQKVVPPPQPIDPSQAHG